MATNTEHKRNQRKRLRDQGLKPIELWVDEVVYSKIEAYKKANKCTYNEALRGLLL